MKILVADDSKTNLSLITSALSNLGHEVIPVQSGAKAIEKFLEETPDLVILDVVMQGIGGFECARQIRNLNTDGWIPIIFLSGSVDDDSIAKGIDAGGDDYLSKPFSEITLAAKIKAMQRISDMRKKLYETTQQLTILSSTDSLTGLYNRLQFNKVIKEQICFADRKKTKFALFYIDLDNFKIINDSLGHPAGDLLLIEVSKRLRACIRGYDFLARLGGDEFALIAYDIESESMTTSIAEKILTNLIKPFNINGNELKISCSIGITYYPDDAETEEVLLQNADIAMYETKQSGKNNYQYFNKALGHKSYTQNIENIIENINEQVHEEAVKKNNLFVLNCLVNSTIVSIDLISIVKIIPLAQLVEIPNTAHYIVGMLNLAGKSVPIIDLNARLNIARTNKYTLETPIIICKNYSSLSQVHKDSSTDNKSGVASQTEISGEIGIIVDKILDINDVNIANIQKTEYKDVDSHFSANITTPNGISFLLNVENVLNIQLIDDLRQNEVIT